MQLATREAWVSDGVYFGWAEPLLTGAEMIVCLDTPQYVAEYRILMRHIKAEASRNNSFPGWGRLYRSFLAVEPSLLSRPQCRIVGPLGYSGDTFGQDTSAGTISRQTRDLSNVSRRDSPLT